MSCVSFRLSQKPWRPIAPCGTLICYLLTSVPRELRPGLYWKSWSLWHRCSPYQGVSQVWWCFLCWWDVACLISVLLLVMGPGIASLTCFHSKHFQISFKWVSCRFVGLGWSEASQVSLLNLLVAVADPDLWCLVFLSGSRGSLEDQ